MPLSDFTFSIFKFITKAQVLKAGLEFSMKTYNKWQPNELGVSDMLTNIQTNVMQMETPVCF